MMKSLEQLGEMIRKQQELMDKTYRADRGQDPESGDEKPMTKEELRAGAEAASGGPAGPAAASSRS